MKRDDKIYLYHIRDSIERIIQYSKNVSYDNFVKEHMIQDAMITQFQIIGQASSRLSKTLKDKYNHIPWKKIIGMRNKLVHDYFGIEVDIIWNTIQSDIPTFKKDVLEIIKDIEQQN